MRVIIGQIISAPTRMEQKNFLHNIAYSVYSLHFIPDKILNYINNILFKRGCAFPSWTPLVFFLKTNLQIISKISADLICSNYFGNKSEFRPRFKGTDYIRAKFTFDFFMKKPQAGFQTKNARKNIRYHSSRTMITCKQIDRCISCV